MNKQSFSSNKINLLIVGFGPHARRIYYPVCKQEENNLGIQIIYGIDLLDKKSEIENYLRERGESLPMFYVESPNYTNILDRKTENELNKIIGKYKIKGVIISTEPLAHVQYAAWALSRGLHVLMDKPVSTVKNSSTSEKAASKIIEDFNYLKELYEKSKAKYGRLLFSLMAQRRYHPAFRKMRELISEVFQKTNCPVTSIQSFHSDGQWRLPSEIIDIKYHSYNDGYGKCSHTGYHSFDIIPWLLEAAENPKKRINNVDIFSNFLRPNDFISQINLDDYQKIFPDFPKFSRYNEKTFRELTYNYGEIDAFNSFAFKHGKDTITLGSANFVHNGFSQRGWLKAKKDLYKGNGRVRHETHLIEQGPFQAISFISYQSSEIDPNKQEGIYDIGGEYHLDIHLFRNHNLFPRWKSYEKFSIRDLTTNVLGGYSRGHQEDARRQAIIEFVNFIKDKKIEPQSNFLDHEHGTRLLTGAYLSAARQFNGKNPLVNIEF